MALWKRGRRYWTYFSVDGVQLRRPLCPLGSTLATTNWQEATRLEKEMIRGALAGELAPRDPSVKLFAAIDDYLEAKKATANSERTIEFDRERLEIVKRHLGDVKLSAITRKTIEGFQAKRRLDGASNRTINMDVGALRQVLRRFKPGVGARLLCGRSRGEHLYARRRGQALAAPGRRSGKGVGHRERDGQGRSVR